MFEVSIVVFLVAGVCLVGSLVLVAVLGRGLLGQLRRQLVPLVAILWVAAGVGFTMRFSATYWLWVAPPFAIALLAVAGGREGRRVRPEAPEARAVPARRVIPATPAPALEGLSSRQASPAAPGLSGRFAAGQRVGEWVLESPLGAGGFGEVWRARHHILPGKGAAVKLPTAPEFVGNLRRLGVLQHAIDDPRVVRPLGLDPEADPPYLAMELVEGADLARVLAERGRLSVPEALRVFREVVGGVAAAHRAGVVHRDLKPANVLLDRDGAVKVTDFELGQVQAATTAALVVSQSLVTSEGRSISGTYAYMAPEQRDGGEVDERADVYSLGLVLFEMLTGELPQPGDCPGDLALGVPAWVDEVFRRCYTRREKRYADAGALEEALVAAGAGAGAPA
ncbi:MAG: serine/threonine protein kinase [Planctomycetes bacterium]|nr:serine/threonine protein kinase [Planctomycetota bacterium]